MWKSLYSHSILISHQLFVSFFFFFLLPIFAHHSSLLFSPFSFSFSFLFCFYPLPPSSSSFSYLCLSSSSFSFFFSTHSSSLLLLVKVPQIVKIVSASSVENLSYLANILELAAVTFTSTYSYAKGFPFR